jgi:hypothetical protein
MEQQLISELRAETAILAKWAGRIQTIISVAGTVLQVLQAFKFITDATTLATKGTVLVEAQESADQAVEQAKAAKALAEEEVAAINLGSAIAVIDDAVRRHDIDTLNELSSELSDVAQKLSAQRDELDRLSKELGAQAKAIRRRTVEAYHGVQQPPDPHLGTIPNASALGLSISLDRLGGTLQNASEGFRDASSRLDTYARWLEGSAKVAENAASAERSRQWKEIFSQAKTMAEQMKRAAEEAATSDVEISRPGVIADPEKRALQEHAINDRLAKHAEKNKAATPKKRQGTRKATGPPKLLNLPPQPQPPSFMVPVPAAPTSLLPGPTLASPTQEPAPALVINRYRDWAKYLLAQGTYLRNRLDSGPRPSKEEIEAFGTEVDEWILGIKNKMNYYTEHGNDQAMNELGKLMDKSVGKLKELVTQLGADEKSR